MLTTHELRTSYHEVDVQRLIGKMPVCPRGFDCGLIVSCAYPITLFDITFILCRIHVQIIIYRVRRAFSVLPIKGFMIKT